MNPAPYPTTEDDIASFLATTPDFFDRHAELLASLQLSSGYGSRVISLQERQAGLLREKIRGLEGRVAGMIRNGQDNLVIAGKMQSWTRHLLQTVQARDVPAAIVQGLVSELQIPQAAIRLWGMAGAYAGEFFAVGTSSEAQAFAASLDAPYCGPNVGFEAAGWLPEAAAAQSLALIPLRTDAQAPVSGLLVLASPDAQRFHSGMGTEFLERLGELAGAAVSRLHAPAAAAKSTAL
ncbi:MAG: hypothetical protein JWP96_2875 [Polaromonas sp.]|nr:hypothetical protein [Polaromonas sp.]